MPWGAENSFPSTQFGPAEVKANGVLAVPTKCGSPNTLMGLTNNACPKRQVCKLRRMQADKTVRIANKALTRYHAGRPKILLPLRPLWHLNHLRNVKKANLPSKICPACQRPFQWRKKWERDWENVKFCSDACRTGRYTAAKERNKLNA